MVEAKDNEVYEEDLVDYEEEVENVADGAPTNGSADVVKKYVLRGGFRLPGFVVGKSDLTNWDSRCVDRGYVGIHSSGFRDFLLKPELLRAIQDCGFEHPSEGKLSSLLLLLRCLRINICGLCAILLLKLQVCGSLGYVCSLGSKSSYLTPLA